MAIINFNKILKQKKNNQKNFSLIYKIKNNKTKIKITKNKNKL